MKKIILPGMLMIAVMINSCTKSDDTPPVTVVPLAGASLVFKFKFDSTQVRLDSKGQPAIMPAGHSAQSPVFNKMSAHYIELIPSENTPVGGGLVLFRAPETTIGGANAIDFSQSLQGNGLAGNGETFFSIPLSSVKSGTYQYIRVSLDYQNYDIKLRVTPTGFSPIDVKGTIASFISFNTYITSYTIKTKTTVVNGNKPQGYWAFEDHLSGAVTTGQLAPGAITVPNPLYASSPTPAGYSMLAGKFVIPLVIPDIGTSDIVITVSLSTNNSFEWKDTNNNNIYEPSQDTVVDMGIRGLIPTSSY